MDTPIVDFLKAYALSDTARFHMPGHKGRGPLGCEALDITEIAGADSLYEAGGIIARSEENAARLFGTGRTLYSTEGSSQCIRAMLYLALQNRPAGSAPVILAARNVHKAFVYAAALLDFEPVWLWPEQDSASLLRCVITPECVTAALDALPSPPAAVYLTSPDYLGSVADIETIAGICRSRSTVLMVDNAHGAYLRFLSPSRHPMDLGADICCDSAHKTLPVLTGGAYLHISRDAPAAFQANARQAMALFGSTSPSYLTLASLDLCNDSLAGNYPRRLRETAASISQAEALLRRRGWQLENTDPLRITIAAPKGHTGVSLSALLREKGMECEYADQEYLVLMLTPENRAEELKRLAEALGEVSDGPAMRKMLPQARGERMLSVRQALFAPQEMVQAKCALGRICGAPTVSCPPAIPIVVSGERIGPEALELFRHYGVDHVSVVKE